MVELSAIYQDAQAAGAQIYPYNIGFADAATIELNGQYGIFLDFDRFSTKSDFFWALIHEVSHCATGCTHRVSSEYDLVARHEYKANRRAIETYLPLDALRGAMRAGYTEPWQLAEYFGLPEAAVRLAVQYWTECRGADLNDGRSAG